MSRVERGKNLKVHTVILVTVLAVDLLQLVLDRSEINLQRRVIAAAYAMLAFSKVIVICLTVIVVVPWGIIIQGIQQLGDISFRVSGSYVNTNLFGELEPVTDLDMAIESVDPRLRVRQVIVFVDKPAEQSGALVLSFAGIPFPVVK